MTSVPDPVAWRRPSLAAQGPNRAAGGLYRSDGDAARPAGVPLGHIDDAVVAAVRLAYDVAATQLDRSDRLARRLRNAGDRAIGPESDKTALDAAEKLVMRSLMSGLEWWETLTSRGEWPVTRLFAAEYELVGTALGLRPKGKAPAATGEAPPPTPAAPQARRLAIVHRTDPRQRRAVTVEAFSFEGAGPLRAEVWLFPAEPGQCEPMRAVFEADGAGKTALTLETAPDAPAGRWTGAICSEAGEQLGIVVIGL